MSARLRMFLSIAIACLLASAILFAGVLFASPITVRLSATQVCPASDFTYEFSSSVQSLVIIGLACPPDSIFKNGFEVAP